MNEVGQRIKALRKQKGVSQSELGDKLGVAFSTISAIENGRSEAPETISAIADFFKVSKAWLINGEGDAPKGVVIPIRKDVDENPWKDAAYLQLKAENERLWKIVENITGGKAANFLKALSQARVTGKVVRMIPATETGAQLGAQA